LQVVVELVETLLDVAAFGRGGRRTFILQRGICFEEGQLVTKGLVIGFEVVDEFVLEDF
jgi:hypothetical protein